MSEFKLDTSGEVVVPSSHYVDEYMIVRFSDLSPFVQGYVEAMFASSITDLQNHGYSWDYGRGRFIDLAPETLARIIEDCERWIKQYPKVTLNARSGADFWLYRQRQWIERPEFPPLIIYLSDDGKVRFQ